ncbi:hypothetical protein TNCV_2760691 [Trichonephila clavipes]|nr:hypothetical protein TNCV_2760691 [Trichonephila clavipes]
MLIQHALRVHTEYVLIKSVGTKVLWVVASETTSSRGWSIFPSPPVPCLNCGGRDRLCPHLSLRSTTCLTGSGSIQPVPRLHGKMYCPGTGCKKLTVKEFKELYPGEKLPNHPDGFMLPQNLSEMYLLPPKTLLELMDLDDPPSVSVYLNYMQVYFDDLKLSRTLNIAVRKFCRENLSQIGSEEIFDMTHNHMTCIITTFVLFLLSLSCTLHPIHMILPPVVESAEFVVYISFAIIGLGHYWPKPGVLSHFSQGHKQMAELRIRGIHFVPRGTRLDTQLNMGQISVHSRDNFNNPFLSGVSVEMGKATHSALYLAVSPTTQPNLLMMHPASEVGGGIYS